MSIIKIIYETCFIILGLILIIVSMTGDLEPYFALLGLGMMGWGAWDLRKELRDRSRKGQVRKLEEEREAIRKRMQERKQ
jgi:hypothetical protein